MNKGLIIFPHSTLDAHLWSGCVYRLLSEKYTYFSKLMWDKIGTWEIQLVFGNGPSIIKEISICKLNI